LLVSLGHSPFGSICQTWRDIASFHHVMRQTSTSADSFADSGRSILSLDFVPQGRAFAFVYEFLCHDHERLGFGGTADIGCCIFAAN
jgi:hypothetical protein